MTTVTDRRPIAPSLLSDPAFSADPYSHPFAITNHETWLICPPAGHPSLKSKSKRTRNRFLASDRAIDSDSEPFPLIQPPNSPVSFEKANDSPTTANPKDVFVPTKSKERHSQPVLSLQGPRSPTEPQPPSAEHSHQLLSLSPQPPPLASNPPKKERTLMTFLKRRSSQQPESSSAVVNPKPKKPSTLTRATTVANDVTRPPAYRQQTEPNIHNVNKPVLLERPVTLGTSTPASTPVPPSPSAAKRRVTDTPVGRLDLDRIDELDETNPWGIALHHGGPYEAAVQAIREKDKNIYAGYGSYHRGVPQSGDNNYAPPQAVGLSLNLLPGQILPRNIYTYNSSAPPPTAVMMKPPGASQTPFAPPTPSPLHGVMLNTQSSTSPLSSRPQSYQPPPAPARDRQPRRQSYDPQASMTPQVNIPFLPPTAPANPPPPQTRICPMPQSQSSPSSPQNQPISGPPTRKPLNQENEDHVTQPRPNMGSIGIGMAMFEDDSDEDWESAASELPSSRNVPSSMTPETNDKQLRRPSPLKFNQPDQASSSESVRSRVVASTSATQESLPSIEQPVTRPSAMQSPPLYTPPTSGIYPAEFQRSQLSIPAQTSSTDSSSGSKPSSQTGNVSHMALHVRVEAEVIHKTTVPQPSFTPNLSNSGSDTSLSIPRAPLRRSSESVQFDDTSSTNPSVSTRSSSSQSRSSMGPPSSRHVPKRLVMPAPLAWHNGIPSSPPQNRLPPPQAQMRPPRAPRPPPRVIPRVPVPVPSPESGSPEAMLPGQTMVKAQAKEIQFATSRVSKLKKRVSLMTTTPMSNRPSAPILTTVSFAPPVIEFESSVATDNKFHRMMTMPKNVLSKHRTN